MAWLKRLSLVAPHPTHRRHPSRAPTASTAYRVAFTLHSADGRRSVEIRATEIYLLEADRSEDGTLRLRHDGRLVGPFASPEHAERFIAATAWFRGEYPTGP